MKKGPATCHPERKNNGGGLCHVCYYQANRAACQARGQAYYRTHADKCKADAKAWRIANPDKVRANRKRHRERARVAGYHFKYTYGLTREQLQAMRAAQGDKCGICRTQLPAVYENGISAQVDHDHATGDVRGILCHHCNKLLGHAKDNPQILANAAHYLMAVVRRRAEKAA